MRSTALRHVVRLRLTLVGPVPEIWREVVVDRELSLADLRGIIQTVFDGQICHHHLFTDTLDSPAWSRSRRRWGDRLTMIDLRDPTVIDEATARIGWVLRDARPLYYGHTCEDGWLVEVDAHEDDLVEASAPPARVTKGERRAPLACCRGAYEHAVLVGVLEDTGHPEHEALLRSIQSALGPWSHFDSEEFDIADTQRGLDLLYLGTRSTHAGHRLTQSGPLDWLVQRLPRAARAGLERHLAACGLDLPAVVTADEARMATREFRWVISRAAESGIPIADGSIDPEFTQAGVDALGCSAERMLQLVAFAKRGRLLYSRNGRLRANKRSATAAEQPSDLWSLLARDLVRAMSPATSGNLFLLAIADGSLADSATGLRRSAEALALLRRGHRDEMWGWQGERIEDCEQACDCPRDGSGTWHDLVARAMRRAAAEGASDGAVPVGAHLGHEAHELGFVSAWFEDPAARPYALATRTEDDWTIDETAMVGELEDLIHLLSMFGLEHTDDGVWIVPPTLQEFARESLRLTSTDRVYGYGPF